jgi:hypothetical protein
MKRILPLFVLAAVFAALSLSATKAFADATVVGVELAQTSRVVRGTLDFSYRVRVKNGPTPLRNVRVIGTTTEPRAQVVKDTIVIGDMAANAEVTSTDLFTVRRSAAVPNPRAISWSIVADAGPSGVAAALAALEASGQIPVLDRSSSLPGPDVDANGVRDDIDRYIDDLPDSAAQKNSLKQIARALGTAIQAGVANVTDTRLGEISALIGRAVKCIWQRYDVSSAPGKVTTLEKLMANTRTRFDAYDAYNTKVSGRSSRLPRGVVCDTP